MEPVRDEGLRPYSPAHPMPHPYRTPAYLGTLHGFTRRFCYGVSIFIRIVSHDHHNISPISVHPISAIVCHCPIRTHRMGDARRTDRFRRQRNLTNRIVLRPPTPGPGRKGGGRAGRGSNVFTSIDARVVEAWR